jgi:acetyl esterase/lipase
VRLGRVVRGLALAAVATAAARALVRRRELVAAVAPELRNPVLWFPMSLTSERVLGVVRSLSARMPLTDVPGVGVDTRYAERPDGGRIRLLLHEPTDRARPSGALVWIHGGGLVLGVPEQSAEICGRFARELGILVVNVDYRLAPDDPFPAGLDDCVGALRWVHEHADELGVDPARVAVGGDSAGGGLTAAVCQRALDEGGAPIAFQALVYPMLDDRTVLRADHAGRGHFVWTPASNAFGWTAYAGHRPRVDDDRPYLAPARRVDLSGLPPAWIGVGDLDLFYEEDVDYAQRLEAAGVPCELHVVPGMFHAAEYFAPTGPIASDFQSRLIEALRGALSATGS